MILFFVILNFGTAIYILYEIKISKPVKKEIDLDYVNGLIDKALRETELN
jgi:hypothetical protein